MPEATQTWHVYLLRCSDGSLYTGITTNLERRLYEHNHTARGARYTRSRRPVELVFSQTCQTRSEALRYEHRLRRLPRHVKLELCAQ